MCIRYLIQVVENLLHFVTDTMINQLLINFFNTDVIYIILEYSGPDPNEYKIIMNTLVIPVFTFNKYYYNSIYEQLTRSAYMKKYYMGARGYYNCINAIAIWHNVEHYNHNNIMWQLKVMFADVNPNDNIKPTDSNSMYGLKSRYHQMALDGPPDFYDNTHQIQDYQSFLSSLNKEQLLCNIVKKRTM